MGAARTLGRIGLASILAGCAPTPEMTPQVRLDLAEGFVACEAQQTHLEAFTLAVFELLEQPLPDDLALGLHIAGQDEIERICSDEAGGCAFEGEAWSNGAVDHHELAHVILRELAPRAVAALSEGIADALGTPSPYWPESTPRLPLASFATRTTSNLEHGERVSAGFYTTFLLEEFGPHAYLDLYRALPVGSSIEEIDARMREHLGASLDELDARFTEPSEARCMVALSFCGDVYGPALEPPFELEQSLACDEPGVLGYAAADGSRHPFRRWQIEIPDGGPYWVEAEGAVISVLRCGSCEERGFFYFNGTALMGGMSVELDAGLYTLEVRELLDGHDTFRLVVREAV